MHAKNTVRSHPTASADEGAERPTEPPRDTKEQSAFEALAAWVNQDSGRGWQARQDLAQTVRMTLDTGYTWVELEAHSQAISNAFSCVRKLTP